MFINNKTIGYLHIYKAPPHTAAVIVDKSCEVDRINIVFTSCNANPEAPKDVHTLKASIKA